MSLKTNVESLLFALGRRTTVDEISRYLRIRDQQKVVEALDELKQDYDVKDGSIVIVKEDGTYKMTVRDDLLPVVRKVVSKTELPKGVMETLAIIAFKTPVLQSDIVRIRTNKAYDHLALLEEMHYITRDKSGRTKMIKLAKKFFDYFDVPEGDLKARFGNVQALEQAVMDKEQEIHTAVSHNKELEAQHKKEEDAYKQDLAVKHKEIDAELAKLPEIDLVDDEGHAEKLETYQSAKEDPVEDPKKLAPSVEVIDELEVYTQPHEKKAKKMPVEVPKTDALHDENATPEEKAEAVREELEETSDVQEDEAPAEGTSKFAPSSVEYEARKVAKGLSSQSGKGLYNENVSKEIEQEIDEKVSTIIGKHDEPKHEHGDDVPSEEVAGDVHVTAEEGEHEERKSGGEDPHAHPGK